MHITVLSSLIAAKGAITDQIELDVLRASPGTTDFSSVFRIEQGGAKNLTATVHMPTQDDARDQDGTEDHRDALPTARDTADQFAATPPLMRSAAQDGDAFAVLPDADTSGQGDAKDVRPTRKRTESLHEAVTSAIMGNTSQPAQPAKAVDTVAGPEQRAVGEAQVRPPRSSNEIGDASAAMTGVATETEPSRRMDKPLTVRHVAGGETAQMAASDAPRILAEKPPQGTNVALDVPHSQHPATIWQAAPLQRAATGAQARITAQGHGTAEQVETGDGRGRQPAQQHFVVPHSAKDILPTVRPAALPGRANAIGAEILDARSMSVKHTPETLPEIAPMPTPTTRPVDHDLKPAPVNSTRVPAESKPPVTIVAAPTPAETGPLPVTPSVTAPAQVSNVGEPAFAHRSDDASARTTESRGSTTMQSSVAHTPLSQTPATVAPPVQHGAVLLRSSEPPGRSAIDILDEVSWDVRPHAASVATPAQMLNARPEMPPHVAQQIAQAMHRMPDRPLEIALNPAELGRVRMTLKATEAGIVVNIVADRPDTLDLMRRNIDDLGQSFEDLGYEDIAFAFGQNGNPSDAPGDELADDADPMTLDLQDHERAPQPHSDTPRLAISAEGVDIRL